MHRRICRTHDAFLTKRTGPRNPVRFVAYEIFCKYEMEAATPSPGVQSAKPKKKRKLLAFRFHRLDTQGIQDRLLAASKKIRISFFAIETTKLCRQILLSIVLMIFRALWRLVRIGTKEEKKKKKQKLQKERRDDQNFSTNMLKLQQSSNVPWIWSIETPIGKTIAGDERANPPCWLVAVTRGIPPRVFRFSRRVDTLFKIFSKFLFTGMCFLYPNPYLRPPVYAFEEENRVQSFSFSFWSETDLSKRQSLEDFTRNQKKKKKKGEKKRIGTRKSSERNRSL